MVWVGIGLVFAISAYGAKRKDDLPAPSQFEIGRHTFFDFGPPFDYYEIFVVKPLSDGSDVERVMLTPAGDRCTQPAKLEVAQASLKEPVSSLLAGTNPCSIPEKELSRELKRRKKYMVFSGANISMQVECGGKKRIIRADILDRDMFDPNPNTPERTSWTMQLLGRLDKAVGPGPMDKPIYAIPSDGTDAEADVEDPTIEDVAGGLYDQLFQSAPDKPSDLYKATKVPLPQPTVHLLSSSPIGPLQFVSPKYPAIARLANFSGKASVGLVVGPAGETTNIVYSGVPLLKSATEEAVKSWKFPAEAAGKTVNATLDFETNCVRK